jgi:hypothetical protein
MDKANYGMMLDTIHICLDCLSATTVDFIPEIGVVEQTIWSEKELRGFKEQLKGLMAMIPSPAYFQNAD